MHTPHPDGDPDGVLHAWTGHVGTLTSYLYSPTPPQDVCIELDLSDATTLPAAVRKTLRVVDAAPRMEGFIAAVCEAVYKRGAAFVPPHIDGTTDPNRVRALHFRTLPLPYQTGITPHVNA